jgi:hypothetical protein
MGRRRVTYYFAGDWHPRKSTEPVLFSLKQAYTSMSSNRPKSYAAHKRREAAASPATASLKEERNLLTKPLT